MLLKVRAPVCRFSLFSGAASFQCPKRQARQKVTPQQIFRQIPAVPAALLLGKSFVYIL